MLLSCTVISFTYGLNHLNGGQAIKHAVKRQGGRFLWRISLLRPLCFRFVGLSSRSLFLKRALRLFTFSYSYRIAVAYCSCCRIMLGGMLRFRDNFKSYYDRGAFVIVGAALFTPPP